MTAYFNWMAALMLPVVVVKLGGPARLLALSWRPVLPVGFFAAMMALSLMLALSCGLVVYVASVKNLSSLISVIIGALVFREGSVRERLAGTALMVLGAAMIISA